MYKATPIAVLKTKTHISPLDLYLNTRLVVFKQQYKYSNMKSLVRKTYKKIRICLQYNNISNELIREE